MAQVGPGGVAGWSFWHENGHDAVVAEAPEAVAVPQHLAESEPELLFLVLVGDALDFGDEDGALGLPGQVEIRLVREPGPRFDPVTILTSGVS